MFLGVMGKSTMTVTGSSTSVTKMPQYIDFYLLLDNSPSMGVGATPADVDDDGQQHLGQVRLRLSRPQQQQQLLQLAKTLGVKTRIDVLRTATQQLMDTAAATQTYTSQFRMAIYDFGASASTAGLRALFALSSSLTQRQDRRRQHRPDDRQWPERNNDQDTQYTNILSGDQHRDQRSGNRHLRRRR